MSTQAELIDQVIAVIVSTLGLDENVRRLDADSALLDEIPELDSMAIVQLVMELEDRFEIEVDEDEITADVFETVASLASFVDAQRPSGPATSSVG